VVVAEVAGAAPRRPRVLLLLLERLLPVERRLLADLRRLVDRPLLRQGLPVDRAEPECVLPSHLRTDLQWPPSRTSARTSPDVCRR
jgi:hypothetical protein